jgi:crotonobetainyl-CoA:carnitine CoA-transferase CaiB-like acyl-CoA transferase
MQMALEGIRILDMTMGQQGPVATQMLADMGAEVIKIEERVTGDVGRRLYAIMGQKRPLDSYFENNNRNKKGIALDLKKEKGREIFFKLVEKSDVFVTNFRATAIKRLGLDYQTLSKINPKLIYAVGSGYGREGPDADKPSFDTAALARGGLLSNVGQPGDPPSPMGFGLADQIGGGILAFGIAVALIARERTGLGQEVNTSLLGSQVWLGSLALAHYLFNGEFREREVDRKKVSNPLWNFYRCQDGKWLQLAMLPSEPYWPNFCEVMGLKHMEKNPRFESHQRRAENSRELIAMVDEIFANKPRKEWKKLLDERDLVWAPVNDYADVAADPQVIANQYIVHFDHPVGKRVKMVGFPVKLSRTPAEIRMPAPKLGQHTDEILFELGYSREDLIRMREGEVIR